MRKLNIALAQIKSLHGQCEKNLIRAINIIEEVAKKGTNIVIFPELFYTGYFNRRKTFHELAEFSDGYLYNKLKETALKYNISIIMGYCEKKKEFPGKVFNSLMFVNNKGELLCSYNKIYCWKKEKRTFTQGEKLFVCETEFGKIGLLNCYDIEFPELFRILHFKGAELVICPAVWSKWIEHRWHSSLMAGAINNLFFVAGINTVGPTPAEKDLCGNSKIISPFGDVISNASWDKEEILYSSIDLDYIKQIREEYPIWNDYHYDMFDKTLLEKY